MSALTLPHQPPLNTDALNAVDHFVRYASEDETEFGLLAWPREHVDCESALWDEANETAQAWIRALCGGEEAYRAAMSSWPAAGVLERLISEIVRLQRLLCHGAEEASESTRGLVEPGPSVPDQENEAVFPGDIDRVVVQLKAPRRGLRHPSVIPIPKAGVITRKALTATPELIALLNFCAQSATEFVEGHEVPAEEFFLLGDLSNGGIQWLLVTDRPWGFGKGGRHGRA